MPFLIITADDYGYSPRYDEGIVEAARAGAIDAVSVMVARHGPDPGPLLAAEVEIGLHFEPVRSVGRDEGLRRGRGARTAAREELLDQLERFQELVGRPPEHLDGHRHCHARGPVAVAMADVAHERGLPVRSVDARHRRLLRCKGVATAGRLVGRMSEDAPVVPSLVAGALRGEGMWGERAGGVGTGSGDRVGAEAGAEGVVEWMTHPGLADPSAGSRYDAGREEDLRVLLELADEPALRRVRASWREISRAPTETSAESPGDVSDPSSN